MEALGVLMHLSLINDTGLVLMGELDGILDSYDVFTTIGIDLVDHGGQSRRFARSGGPVTNMSPLGFEHNSSTTAVVPTPGKSGSGRV